MNSFQDFESIEQADYPEMVVTVESGMDLVAGLRRHLGYPAIEWKTVRKSTQLKDALPSNCRGIVLWEVTESQLEDVLQGLTWLEDQHPKISSILIFRQPLSGWDLYFRQRNVLHIEQGIQRLDRIARLLVHMLEQLPLRQVLWYEKIWRKLPWAKWATTNKPLNPYEDNRLFKMEE
ncbi:Hypothetical protein PBC10988_7690 [Planctomycetales bacterium 10988]|nr:Hypothetical protein PBC10988_7690 [Planctomycetales bacterium 10988]